MITPDTIDTQTTVSNNSRYAKQQHHKRVHGTSVTLKEDPQIRTTESDTRIIRQSKWWRTWGPDEEGIT